MTSNLPVFSPEESSEHDIFINSLWIGIVYRTAVFDMIDLQNKIKQSMFEIIMMISSPNSKSVFKKRVDLWS